MDIDNVLAGLNSNHSSITDLITNMAYFSDEAATHGGLPMGQTVAVQADGKVIFAGVGSYDSATGVYIGAIRRYNADGTEDSTFSPPAFKGGDSGQIRKVALQPDGKIVVVGHFGSAGDSLGRGIVRLNSDGTLDDSFVVGSGFNNNAFCAHLMGDGSILVGGTFSSYNGASLSHRVARINSDGSLASSFGPNANVHSVAVDSSGRVLAGGQFAKGIARYLSDGTQDSGFNVGSGFSVGVGSNPRVSSIQVDSAGKIFVGHWFTKFNGSACSPGVTKLNSDGTIDNSFATQGSGLVDSNNGGIVQVVKVLSDGKLLVGGFFNSCDENRTGHVARLNSDGTLDPTFESGRGFNDNTGEWWGPARVNSIVEHGNSVYFAGNFTSYDRSARWAYAVTDANGALKSFSVKPPEGTFGIADGFQDMYDDGNYFNTNLTQMFQPPPPQNGIRGNNVNGSLSIPNTHTPCFVEANLTNDFRDDSSNTWDNNGVSYRPVADGQVMDGSAYFGSGSEYFTNMYPGMFVLGAVGVDISEFSIAGGLGSNGDGTDATGMFPLVSGSGLNYVAYFKTNYMSSAEGGERGNNDISVNHLIVIPGEAGGVTRVIDETSEYDDHCVSGLGGRGEIYVLVFGRWDGNKVSTEEASAMANKFMEVISGRHAPPQDCNNPCEATVGYNCFYKQNSSTKCKCSVKKLVSAGGKKSGEGVHSALSRAYLPAITVCNMRLF